MKYADFLKKFIGKRGTFYNLDSGTWFDCTSAGDTELTEINDDFVIFTSPHIGELLAVPINLFWIKTKTVPYPKPRHA